MQRALFARLHQRAQVARPLFAWPINKKARASFFIGCLKRMQSARSQQVKRTESDGWSAARAPTHTLHCHSPCSVSSNTRVATALSPYFPPFANIRHPHSRPAQGFIPPPLPVHNMQTHVPTHSPSQPSSSCSLQTPSPLPPPPPRPPPPSAPGDVGSDDDWHCTMGSNSDADDESLVVAATSEHRLRPSSTDHQLQDDDIQQQCVLIPNYRGVSDSSSAFVPPADRARCISSSSSLEHPERRTTPPQPAAVHVLSKHASKVVSFDTTPHALPRSIASTLSVTSSFSAGGAAADDCSPSSDAASAPLPPQQPRSQPPPARLAKSKLIATMRQLRKGTSSEKSTALPLKDALPKSLSNDNIDYSASSTSSTHVSQRSTVVPSAGATSMAAAASGRQRTQMFNTAAMIPRSHSYKNDRHTSAPGESFTARGGAGAQTFSLYASPSISRKFSSRKSPHPAPTPTTKTLSFLECVLELLKGSIVYRRRNFVHHPQVYLWLTPDLLEIRYRYSRKGNVPITEVVSLNTVSKLKGSDRELSLEFSTERKRVDFLFPSKGNADVWLSGLCCLVPAYASVRSRDKIVGLRENYDPLTDSWNGKKIELRKRLGQYILLGTIGRGSFGKVKLALCTRDRQFYAVKVLSKAMMRKRIRTIPLNGMYLNSTELGELEANDVNEIQVMQTLRHENVIQYIGVYNDRLEDRFYIVLEFLARGPIMSSAKLKGADPLSAERAKKAFVDVLAGIEYLHHLNIAHRDIKPDNLLEAGDGTVKISDFGAAVKCKVMADGEEELVEYSTAGTPAFTAPEVAISDNTPKQAVDLLAADMWSLGATLYYMIFGRAPFIAKSVFEMYDTICRQELEFPSGVDEKSDVCVLIKSLLQKKPERRATVETVLKSAWLARSAAVAAKVESIRQAVARHRGS
eukprot:TRINITY_DN564_c0_g1_i1.p1 TRINITY_DN564_c0_g1~~TRINITY_DN564_c0_g1_i1.p1  ORF type:complete len:915 (-),score=137.35 TRINITY_DN564_c0_g1_i1:514-3258(-)